jgi:hypothetical protein
MVEMNDNVELKAKHGGPYRTSTKSWQLQFIAAKQIFALASTRQGA